MRPAATVASLCALMLWPGGADAEVPRDQFWIDTQRVLLQREWSLQTSRINDFNQAAQKGLEASVDRVLGWVNDNFAAADPKALFLGGDAALPLLLVQQNLDIYREAIRGDWSTYRTKLAESLWSEIIELLPEKFHPSVLDPTIFEQLFDLRTLADLKQRARSIDAIQERLTKMQTLIDSAQKELDAAKVVGRPAILESNNQIVKDIDDWLANAPTSLKPLPENADGTDKGGDDLDKVLNENITREMGGANSHLPDFLIHSPLNYTCTAGPCTLDQWMLEWPSSSTGASSLPTGIGASEFKQLLRDAQRDENLRKDDLDGSRDQLRQLGKELTGTQCEQRNSQKITQNCSDLCYTKSVPGYSNRLITIPPSTYYSMGVIMAGGSMTKCAQIYCPEIKIEKCSQE